MATGGQQHYSVFKPTTVGIYLALYCSFPDDRQCVSKINRRVWLNYRIAADVELMMRFLELHRVRVRYLPEVLVKMRMGGTTNKSLRNIAKQNDEILRALRKHGLAANPLAFFGKKIISRGKQFIFRPRQLPV